MKKFSVKPKSINSSWDPTDGDINASFGFGPKSSGLVRYKEGTSDEIVGGTNCSSSEYIKGEEDEWDSEEDEWDEDEWIDEGEFYDTEGDVWEELGLYLDFSGIRGGGDIWVFSDPEQQNMSDMWEGDYEDQVACIDYDEHEEKIQDIMHHPRSEWAKLYKEYLQSEVEKYSN